MKIQSTMKIKDANAMHILLTGTSCGVVRNMPGISTGLGINVIGNHIKVIEIVSVTVG